MVNTLFLILLTHLMPVWCTSGVNEISLQPDTNNIFEDGTVYKIGIQSSGIYQISASWLTSQLDTELEQISSSTIQIYGIKSGPLRDDTEYDETERLVSFSIDISDNGDGIFDNNDFILFYAEGPDRVEYDLESGIVNRIKNPYSDINYVFLKIHDRDIVDQNIVLEEFPKAITNESNLHLYYDFYHEDKINLLDQYESTQGSGQNWYGDELTNLKTYDLKSKLEIPSEGLSNALLTAAFAVRSSQREDVSIITGSLIEEVGISPVNTSDIEARYARQRVVNQEVSILNSNDALSITYNKATDNARLWFDYASLQGETPAIYRSEQTFFNNYNLVSRPEVFDGLQINSNQDITFWDVTDPSDIIRKNKINQGTSVSIAVSPSIPESYIGFREADIKIPESAALVLPADIISTADVDLIIITPDILQSSAEELQNHRLSHDNLASLIVSPEEIYNLYSSGRQDPTAIRNYARDLYQNYPRFSYLLLLGDASFDYRHINKNYPANNLVPTYETLNSLDPILSFPADDYYALLDDGENGQLRGDLDISVGRLTVADNAEAASVIKKIITYDEPSKEIDNWKTKVVFVADDEDNNLHINDADIIATEMAKDFPLANQEKIYMDAFRQESTPGGNRYPTVTNELNKNIEQGALVVNYLGHGGPTGWAQERILKVDDINSYSNIDKLPLIITATCSFTGFDDASEITAGEAALLNPIGGAVSLFTTVRSVYASKNFQLTRSVFRQLWQKENGSYLTIGEIMRRAKNDNPSDNTNSRKFFLIGDPTLKLSIPSFDIVTEQINDIDLSNINAEIRLSALDVVSLQATVRQPDGRVAAGYNGKVDIVVYDKPTEVNTFGNDRSSFVKSFQLQQNVIYKGRATVKNGEIKTSFTIPVDIDYSVGKAKVSYYALSDDKIEAAGYTEQLSVGGDAAQPVTDNQPPVVKAYLNDRNFTDGAIVPASNVVIVDLTDDYGLNLSSTAIGHEITAVIDGETKSTIFLNEFIEGDEKDPTAGSIIFNMEDLSIGPHTLTIKAFDIANNPGEVTISFIVSNDIERSIQSIILAPNPITTGETTITIAHDLIESDIQVTLEAYSASGQRIEKVVESVVSRDGQLSFVWKPRCDINGILICYLTLKSISNPDNVVSGVKKVILLK